MTTRQEKINYLTKNELEWFLVNGEDWIENVSEFFAKGGFSVYTDEAINQQFEHLTA